MTAKRNRRTSVLVCCEGIWPAALVLVAIWLVAAAPPPSQKKMGVLQVAVVEARQANQSGTSAPQSEIRNPQSKALLPCRVHLTANGKPVYAPGCPRWERDAEFCCDGGFRVEVPAGKVEILIERGPEWESHSQTFDLEAGTTRTIEVALPRWIDMNARGWYSGDLHVHRPVADMPLLMRADDLNVAPDLTYWNERRTMVKPPHLNPVRDPDGTSPRPRFFHTLNQEDERAGGAILIFNLRQPIIIENIIWHWPTGLVFHQAALEQGAHVEQEKPFWWEAPVHVALGRIASMGIVHNHFFRRGVEANEAWGRPRDRTQYPDAMGFCFYNLDLYYRYLNLGWDIPISAGSASGVLPSPLGYSRVYVQMDQFSYDGWFEGLRAGRNFATNGPLIFATVNGQLIGARFAAEAGKPFEATVRFEVLCREPLDRAEIVVGGKVAETFRPAVADRRRIAAEHRLTLDRSTWIAVRAFEDYGPAIRFAHTSPFYLTVGGQRRRDRQAAEFFVQWTDDLIARTEKNRQQFQNDKQLADVLETYRRAREVYARMAGGDR